MEKQEIRKQLIHKRMETKAEIEKYRMLSKYTNRNYEKEINEKLDLIGTIDKIIAELDK